MRREQEGIVLELDNSVAKVKVARHADCENCGSCPGSKAMVLEVNNKLGAKKGDKVIFEQKQKSMLKAAFIVYVLPWLFVFIGTEAGMYISSLINGQAEIMEISGGAAAFVLSIVFITYYEKASRSNLNKLPRITRIT